MQVKKTELSPTKVEITITATAAELDNLKIHVLQKLSGSVSVAGFRKDKVPLELVEKNLNSSSLQQEFLQEAVNHLYADALQSTQTLVVALPKVEIKTFVPYSDLTFTAEVDCVGKITLPKYQTFRLKRQKISVEAADVKTVLENLKQKSAERLEVTRAAKLGDELVIDFEGLDSKNEPIPNATSKDYSIVLGSDLFIPGFEDNLVGLKKGAEKTFTVKFPKDYGVKMLAGKPVTFKVKVDKVSELQTPALDDKFALKVSPFKNLADLKADIKKQILEERNQQAQAAYENDVIAGLVAKTKVEIPDILVDEQIDRELDDLKRNLTYRGVTFPEHLKELGTDDEGLRLQLRPRAEQRVKAGLMLGAISDAEKLQVTAEEVTERLISLKNQYSDAAMQSELESDNAKQEIGSRLLTEKTIKFLVATASKN